MGTVNLKATLAAGCLVTALALLTACQSPREPSLEPALWQDFQQRFVQDGRVIDSGNADISHSEGQGYGMLLALAADDQRGFDELWQWTASVLQRDDALLCWRYTPCPAQDASCVSDSNNASDGDLLVAWALLRAHDAWGAAAYRDAALGILATAAEKLVVTHAGYTLLLPGAVGFRHGDAVTVNLSYWVFPALQAFATAQPAGPWQALIDSGVALVERARFGDTQLPPDWLELDDEGLRPSPRFPARYGFDAVRIPLYMAWAGLASADDWRGLKQLWQRDPVPAWVDLADDSTAEYAWSRGMASVAGLLGSAPVNDPLNNPANNPADSETDYYSHTLLLLTRIAAAERES